MRPFLAVVTAVGAALTLISGLPEAHAASAPTSPVTTRLSPAKIDSLRKELMRADQKARKQFSEPQFDGKARLPAPKATTAPSSKPAAKVDLATCRQKTAAPDGKHGSCVVPWEASRKIPEAAVRDLAADAKASVEPRLAATREPRQEAYSFCRADTQEWVATRFQACRYAGYTDVIYDIRTEKVLGTIDLLTLDMVYAIDVNTVFGRYAAVRSFPETATGVGLEPGWTVEAVPACFGQCTTISYDYPPQYVNSLESTYGSALFQGLVDVGEQEVVSPAFTLIFANANLPNILPGTLALKDPPILRCDDLLPGIPYAGCVFTSVAPTYPLSTSGEYPQFARHIADAQGSGLPGAPGGRFLRRMVNPVDQDRNGDTACPRRYTRPDTKSCDEYPFRSTYEGAATAQPRGTARTFDWCDLKPPEPTGVTGPTGYSVCMIDARQNSRGGGQLQRFYNSARVIDHDAFYVEVDGSGGQGPDPEPADHRPVVDAGPDVTGYEGSAVSMVGSVRDDFNPNPIARWSYAPGAGVDAGATCTFVPQETTASDATVTTQITCTDDGEYIVTLEGDDGEHDTPGSDTARVTLSNVSPQLRRNDPGGRLVAGTNSAGTSKAAADETPLGIVSPKPWQLFRVNDPVELTTNFTDPGSNDTQTCAINWDDGTKESAASGKNVCAGTHRFTHAGMYTITPTITDDDGGVSEAASVMVVVYDSRAGFNNSDGSFTSTSGLLTTQPSASGEEWFHLAAEYYRQDETVPVGEAQTWLAGTDFRFVSGPNRMEWLVVTPDGKVAAKGRGQLQGKTGEYGYVFYGYQSCSHQAAGTGCQTGPDRFRVVIWPLSAGSYPTGNAIYDNRPAAGYDVDVADPQNLKSGIVTIHPDTGQRFAPPTE
jgi:hypothetical protein